MPTDAVATPNSWDEWTTDQLDLHAYLNRIGHTGPLTADAATLAALHRAHVAAIPFENLDVILGRGISVALPDVQRKLVEARRGGYCYEHGLLFAAVATRLGFTAQRLLARVGDLERPRPRTHLVTLLTDPSGEAWLADPGFGSGLLTPLPLRADAEATQGAWTYRLRRLDDGRWQLQEAAAGRPGSRCTPSRSPSTTRSTSRCRTTSPPPGRARRSSCDPWWSGRTSTRYADSSAGSSRSCDPAGRMRSATSRRPSSGPSCAISVWT